MKSLILISFCIGLSSAIHAQQKPSQRSFADEVKKVRAKQSERSVMLSRQQVSADTVSTSPNRPASVPVPTQTKPSQGPMRLPARARKQQ